MSFVHKSIITLILVGSLCCLCSACSPVLSAYQTTASASTSTTNVSFTMGVSSLYVYPEQTADLTYSPLALKGDSFVYRWVCTDGTITGTGPKVTWKAPNQYGVFHIMATVKNEKGETETATADITVVPPPPSETKCPSCK